MYYKTTALASHGSFIEQTDQRNPQNGQLEDITLNSMEPLEGKVLSQLNNFCWPKPLLFLSTLCFNLHLYIYARRERDSSPRPRHHGSQACHTRHFRQSIDNKSSELTFCFFLDFSKNFRTNCLIRVMFLPT